MKLEFLEDVRMIAEDNRKTITMVFDPIAQKYFIKKLIRAPYAKEVYETLMAHPHEGFACVYVVKETQEGLVVVEEFINGNTLEYEMEEYLPNIETANVYILELLDTLEHLHHLSPPIIHRDIKPANIMVDRGHVRLIDFDIAREFDVNQRKDTIVMGSIGYAAPEQYGFSQSDPRTDIYAMGILINEIYTGVHPSETLVSGYLKDVVTTCIHMDPSQRYKNVEELRQAFLQIKAETHTTNNGDSIVGMIKTATFPKWRILYDLVVVCVCIGQWFEAYGKREWTDAVGQAATAFFSLIVPMWIATNTFGLKDQCNLQNANSKLGRIARAIGIWFIYTLLGCMVVMILTSLLKSMLAAYQIPNIFM